MTNILKALAVVATLVVGTAAINGLALASPDSPFYPDRLNSANTSPPHLGAGSGIPWQYRVGK